MITVVSKKVKIPLQKKIRLDPFIPSIDYTFQSLKASYFLNDACHITRRRGIRKVIQNQKFNFLLN